MMWGKRLSSALGRFRFNPWHLTGWSSTRSSAKNDPSTTPGIVPGHWPELHLAQKELLKHNCFCSFSRIKEPEIQNHFLQLLLAVHIRRLSLTQSWNFCQPLVWVPSSESYAYPAVLACGLQPFFNKRSNCREQKLIRKSALCLLNSCKKKWHNT